MKLKILLSLTVCILVFGCGFKVVDQNSFKEYKILSTEITGDKRVSYLLFNKLKIGNKNSPKTIKINVATEKAKKIKEKNIQNEITKYEVTISAKIIFEVIDSNNNGEFNITKKGDYNVTDRHSETLNNEKKLINNLVNDIADQLFDNLRVRLDDF